MMATMHAMGSRKKAEGGVSLSGSADSARSRIYRAVDPDLNTLVYAIRYSESGVRKTRDHFNDTDVISTILDPFAEIRLKLVSLHSSFSH